MSSETVKEKLQSVIEHIDGSAYVIQQKDARILELENEIATLKGKPASENHAEVSPLPAGVTPESSPEGNAPDAPYPAP